ASSCPMRACQTSLFPVVVAMHTVCRTHRRWSTRSVRECSLPITDPLRWPRARWPCPARRRGHLQVSRRVHPLVEDADHVDAILIHDVKDEMANDGVPAVTLADIVTGAATVGILRNALDRCPYLADVGPGLVDAPPVLCVVPDGREVPGCGRRQPISSHPFLLAAMYATKSTDPA